MAVTISNGGTSFVGASGVNLFRLIAMVQGLRFEIKFGHKMSRCPSCYALAKREFGFKGSKEKVLVQLEAVLAAAKANETVIDERTSAET